jgi:hypothetical protein
MGVCHVRVRHAGLNRSARPRPRRCPARCEAARPPVPLPRPGRTHLGQRLCQLGLRQLAAAARAAQRRAVQAQRAEELAQPLGARGEGRGHRGGGVLVRQQLRGDELRACGRTVVEGSGRFGITSDLRPSMAWAGRLGVWGLGGRPRERRRRGGRAAGGVMQRGLLGGLHLQHGALEGAAQGEALDASHHARAQRLACEARRAAEARAGSNSKIRPAAKEPLHNRPQIGRASFRATAPRRVRASFSVRTSAPVERSAEVPPASQRWLSASRAEGRCAGSLCSSCLMKSTASGLTSGGRAGQVGAGRRG